MSRVTKPAHVTIISPRDPIVCTVNIDSPIVVVYVPLSTV